MPVNTHRFFTDFLGFKSEEFHRSSISWLPSVANFIAHDPDHRRFTMPFAKGEEKLEQWLETLNYDATRIIDASAEDEEESRVFFTILKTSENDETRIAISQKSMKFLEQNANDDKNARYHLARTLGRLYNAFLNYDIGRLMQDAFNLPWHKKSWGSIGGFEMREILYTDDNGAQMTDQTLYFGQHGHAERSALLAEDIHATLDAGLAFMKGSMFLSDEQKELLEDFESNPLLRVRYEGQEDKDHYSVALDMKAARIMQKAGVAIDLSGIVDYHFHRGFGGPIASISNQIFAEEESAAKMLARQFNLAALTGDRGEIRQDKETILSLSGESSDGHSYSTMTDRPIEWETGKYLSQERAFRVSISFKHIKPDQFKELAASLNNQFADFLRGNGIEFESSVFQISEKDEQRMSMPYNLIDTMIRKNLVFDSRPVIMPYLENPVERIQRLTKVRESIEDTVGHAVRYPSMPEKFLAGKERKYGENFSISFEQEFRTSKADFPIAKSIFEQDRDNIQKLLDDYSLSKDIEIGSFATRWAGGLTGHSLRLKLRVFSLEHAEDLAERFALVKEPLRPLLQQAAAKCYMKSLFEERMFGYPKSETSQYEEWLRFIYVRPIAEIESLAQGMPQEDMDSSIYESLWTNIGRSIQYLALAERNTKNAQVRGIASEHLKAMAGRSALISGLIEQIRLKVIPPSLTSGVAITHETIKLPHP